MNDRHWMLKAYELAQQAFAEGEVPVGAVVVDAHNQLIGQGYNQTRKNNDPTAHAEIIALRDAAFNQHNYRLNKASLYVTLEPCVMCAGALVHARIERLVFATRDFEVGAAGSVCNVLKGYPWNHQVSIDEGLLEEDCELLLKRFFALRRVKTGD